MLKESYSILDSIRLSNGLYLASPSEFYSYVWIRDSFYISLPYIDKEDGNYEKAYHRMLDLFKEYEWKIDIAIQQKPQLQWQYLHARYSAEKVQEIHEQEWGHAQNDMVGAFLYGIGKGLEHRRKVIRDDKDKEIIQKLVYYLESVKYWEDEDNGMWEEWKEVHMSSVGACVAGLRAVSNIVDIPEDLIEKGIDSCFGLFPRESKDKSVDLAQLSLIYPYNIFGTSGERILKNVEEQLVRTRGVIRYKGDSYYSTLEKSKGRDLSIYNYYGSEAEWTFGFPWLSLCYYELGNIEKAKYYLAKTEEVMIEPGLLPEAYFSNSEKYNPNTPLGWSVAMYILAKEKLKETDY